MMSHGRGEARAMFFVGCALLAAIHYTEAKCGAQSRPCSDLSTTVTYRERMLLPRVADIRVDLLDAADHAQPKVVLERTIPTNGRQVPIHFTLPLPASSMDPRHIYYIKAEIL